MNNEDTISRAALLEWAREFYQDEKQFQSAVINAPTIDPVHAAGGCRCEECAISGHCSAEDVFRIARRKDPFCCAGKPLKRRRHKMPEREILFRGKRLDNGEWVEGYYIGHAGCCHFIIPAPFGGYIAQDGSFYAPVAYMVDPSTVSRCTGLTDKHGTRIFEGDILNENGEHFTVVYDTKWAKFKLQYVHAIQYPEWNRGVEMEVIGNRWDNPELLGGAE